MTELLKEALETIKTLKEYCESDDPGLEIGAPVIAKLEKAIESDECLRYVNRKPVAWRKNYQNSGYTYFDERWGTIPNDAEPLFSN